MSGRQPARTSCIKFLLVLREVMRTITMAALSEKIYAGSYLEFHHLCYPISQTGMLPCYCYKLGSLDDDRLKTSSHRVKRLCLCSMCTGAASRRNRLII
jgi:hypothetical protein